MLDIRLSDAWRGHFHVGPVGWRGDLGAVLGVIGDNGSGKTTLLDALSGFVRASGQVRWNGQRIDGMPPWRRHRLVIARTFQGSYPPVRVGELLTVAERWSSSPSLLRDLRRSLASLLDRALSALSYGQRKRILTLAALSRGMPVSLLDEPFDSLDEAATLSVVQAIKTRTEAGGIAIVTAHTASGPITQLGTGWLHLGRGRDAPSVTAGLDSTPVEDE